MFYNLTLYNLLPSHPKMIRVPPMVGCSSNTSENNRGFYFVALYPCSSHFWSAQGTPWIALINLVERMLAWNLQCALQGKSAFTLCVLLSISSQNLKKGGGGALTKRAIFLFYINLLSFSMEIVAQMFHIHWFHLSVNHPVNRASMTIFNVLVYLRLSRAETCLYILEIILIIKEYCTYTKP